VLGHEVRDLAEAKVCCGFGGSFSFDYPRISERLMNRKLDDAQATGALEIVTDNQGCIMQLRGGSDAQGRGLQVLHLAQLVDEGITAARERLEAERPHIPQENSAAGSDDIATT
jgi:Fe-S oxidoreductase